MNFSQLHIPPTGQSFLFLHLQSELFIHQLSIHNLSTNFLLWLQIILDISFVQE